MRHDSKTGPEASVSATSTTTGQPADAGGGRPNPATGDPRAWHTLPAEDVARALQTDPARGLTDAEVARRRQQFGPNALAASKGRSALSILVDQFRSLIVALLAAATGVAFAMGETIEAVAVLVVIVL